MRFMNGKLYSHDGLKPASEGSPLILPRFRSDNEGNSPQPYKHNEESYFYPLPPLHQCLQLWVQLRLERCSVHRGVWAWVVLTRSCREAAPQKPAQENNCSFSNNHPHHVNKEDSESRRQHKQVLSQASKGVMPNPAGWLWAPSTAFLHGQSMCMVSLTLLFWCLNESGACAVISPLNQGLLLPSFMKPIEA